MQEHSTESHSFTLVTVITVVPGHRLRAGTSSGRACTQQPSSVSGKAWWLIISKQGTFFCSPLSKERMVTAAGNAESAEGKPLCLQRPCRDPAPFAPPHYTWKPRSFSWCLGYPVPANTHQRLHLSPVPNTDSIWKQGQFWFVFMLFISKEKSTCYIKGLLFC